MTDADKQPNAANEFEKAAADDRISFMAELWDFLKHNKKWWLLPILGCMALLIALIVISMSTGGAAAPFIYTLF